tara:strand:- start:332 stop:961 length:630 start_codon:yes stop_codon:yes gene_type:complete
MNSKNKKKHNDSEENNIKKTDLKDGSNSPALDKNEKKINISEQNDQKANESTKYEEEISKLREEKLRLLAEMENIRKIAQREKIESVKFGSSSLARDILSPNDNLVRALENIPNDKILTKPISNLIDGIKMVQKELTTILEKHDVKKIESLNKKFDHNLHQAMMEIETDKQEEGFVVKEIQSGYIMHDRLLRPALVGVAKKAKKNKEKN